MKAKYITSLVLSAIACYLFIWGVINGYASILSKGHQGVGAIGCVVAILATILIWYLGYSGKANFIMDKLLTKTRTLTPEEKQDFDNFVQNSGLLDSLQEKYNINLGLDSYNVKFGTSDDFYSFSYGNTIVINELLYTSLPMEEAAAVFVNEMAIFASGMRKFNVTNVILNLPFAVIGMIFRSLTKKHKDAHQEDLSKAKHYDVKEYNNGVLMRTNRTTDYSPSFKYICLTIVVLVLLPTIIGTISSFIFVFIARMVNKSAYMEQERYADEFTCRLGGQDKLINYLTRLASVDFKGNGIVNYWFEPHSSPKSRIKYIEKNCSSNIAS